MYNTYISQFIIMVYRNYLYVRATDINYSFMYDIPVFYNTLYYASFSFKKLYKYNKWPKPILEILKLYENVDIN